MSMDGGTGTRPAATGGMRLAVPMVDVTDIVAAHETQLASLDPLLPRRHPLPDAGPGEDLLIVDGADGPARRSPTSPASLPYVRSAADQHRLLRRGGGPDPVAAMGAVLDRWCDCVAATAAPGDPDSGAVLTWPSRDVAMNRLFLDRGLAPV